MYLTMSNASTASLLSSTSTLAPPRAQAQKDYLAAFADLQSTYGMGGLVRGTSGTGGPPPPPLRSTAGASETRRRWYRTNKSSPTPSSTPSPSPSHSPSHPYAHLPTTPPHHATHHPSPPPPPPARRTNKQEQYETALGALMERYGHGAGGRAFGYDARCSK
ncbi:hypothetical protein F5I97DRAFT_264665 [Phlebopus sp. FC_14]|nr:hypothetical protein F5I97DRAFT_264665 [Phlebopus sp. FC_14]